MHDPWKISVDWFKRKPLDGVYKDEPYLSTNFSHKRSLFLSLCLKNVIYYHILGNDFFHYCMIGNDFTILWTKQKNHCM